MKRVMIIGNGGAGKSTLARRLGQLTGLPVHHLDALFWQPRWTPMEREAFLKLQKSVLEQERWIVDGNFNRTISVRAEQADTIIFLNLNRWLCLWGVISRRFKYRNSTRPDTGVGCPERLDFEFLKWVWHYPSHGQAKAMSQLGDTTGKTFLNFTRRRDLQAWLARLAHTGASGEATTSSIQQSEP